MGTGTEISDPFRYVSLVARLLLIFLLVNCVKDVLSTPVISPCLAYTLHNSYGLFEGLKLVSSPALRPNPFI